jgi:hypothetical protein
MLGNILYELNDIKIMSQRILEDPNRTRIECTIYASANFRGIDITETTTFWTTPTSGNNDILYGEAKGVLMTKDRQGLATSGESSATNKLSYLNNLIGPFEYDIDEYGRGTLKIWEWK